MEFKRLKFPIAAPMFIVIAAFTFIGMIVSLVNGSIFSALSALIMLPAYVLLIIDLFMKKRGILTVIGTALPTFAAFIGLIATVVYMIQYLTMGYHISAGNVIHYIVQILFDLAAIVCWLIMLLTVFSLIPPLSFDKLKLDKFRALVNKFWFAPCALILLCSITSSFISFLISAFEGYLYFGSVVNLFTNAIACAVPLLPWFFMCMWLKDPYDNRPAKDPSTIVHEVDPSGRHPVDDAKLDMMQHILLTLFTGGFWQLLWIYKTTAALNRVPGEEDRSPLKEFLLSLIPYYWVYWAYKSAQRIDALARMRGLESNVVVLDLLMSLLLGSVGPILMQEQINRIIDGTSDQRTELATARRDLIFHIVMLVATGGFYQLWWIYKTTAALNGVATEDDRSPIREFLMCLIPYYWIFWTYKSALRVEAHARAKGQEQHVLVLDLLMSIFLGILGPIFMQAQINSIVDAPAPVAQ